MIVFHSMPSLIQQTISTPHTGCKLISHIKENKEMVAVMVVLCPSNSPGHTYMGPLFEFHRGVAFPLHHGGIFALKGSALSRVYYLARA